MLAAQSSLRDISRLDDCIAIELSFQISTADSEWFNKSQILLAPHSCQCSSRALLHRKYSDATLQKFSQSHYFAKHSLLRMNGKNCIISMKWKKKSLTSSALSSMAEKVIINVIISRLKLICSAIRFLSFASLRGWEERALLWDYGKLSIFHHHHWRRRRRHCVGWRLIK